jgi:hypothetical protein
LGYVEWQGELTRWESVRINDEIGLDTALRERHVDGWPELRADTLLSVTGRELVTNDGLTGYAVLHAEGLAWLRAVFRAHDANAVNEALFRVFVFDELCSSIYIDV